MNKHWVYSGIAGFISALLLILGFRDPALAATVANFSHIPLFMVALGLGLPYTAFAGIVGLIVMILAIHQTAAIFFGLAVILPAVILAYFGLLSRQTPGGEEWYSPGKILCWLTAAAFAILTSFTLATSNPDNPLFTEMRQGIMDYLSANMPPDQMNAAEMEILVLNLLPYIPGMIVAMFLLSVVANAIIAQWVLVKFNVPARPTPSMSEIRLPQWTPILIAALGLGITFGEGLLKVWAINILIVGIVPLMLAGLGIMHSMAQGSSRPLVWLGLVYIVLVLSPFTGFIPVFLLAGLGVVEQWIPGRSLPTN